MIDLNSILTPAMLVKHPNHDEWGIGQVQTKIGNKITVNFPEQGKVVIDGTQIALEPIFDTEA